MKNPSNLRNLFTSGAITKGFRSPLSHLATATILSFSITQTASAASFTATFDNLLFSGGETVNGSFTYNDDTTCCTATTGSITATGGIFTGETVVWEPNDVFLFDNDDGGSSGFGVTKNTASFNNAVFFFFSNVGQLTTLGNVPLGFSQVNRDGIAPSNFVSGTVTISEAVTETVPEPTSMLALLALGGMGLAAAKKKAA